MNSRMTKAPMDSSIAPWKTQFPNMLGNRRVTNSSQSDSDEESNDAVEETARKIRKKGTKRKKMTTEISDDDSDDDVAEENAENIKGTKKEEEIEVADDDDVATLLTRRTQSGKFVFMQQSIIAERRVKGKKDVVEHLIIALPEWRQYDHDRGTGRDDDHARVWEELKDGNQTLELESIGYDPITIHRSHPILSKHNGSNGLFGQRITPSQIIQQFDLRDRQEAREMLGHMLKHAANQEEWLTAKVATMLTRKVFNGIHDPQPGENYTTEEAHSCAKRFLEAFDFLQRGQLGQDLLVPEVVEDEDWIGALAIVLLSAHEVMQRMHQLRKGRATTEVKKERYREMTTRFLSRYHAEYKANTSFVHVLHTFYTLTRILREDNGTNMEAEAHEGDDGGSDEVSDGQEEACFVDDSDGGSDEPGEAHVVIDEDKDKGKKAPKKGAKEKEPAKKKAAPKAKAGAAVSKKREASPAEKTSSKQEGAKGGEHGGL